MLKTPSFSNRAELKHLATLYRKQKLIALDGKFKLLLGVQDSTHESSVLSNLTKKSLVLHV